MAATLQSAGLHADGANFSLFWGLSIMLYKRRWSRRTPFDKFRGDATTPPNPTHSPQAQRGLGVFMTREVHRLPQGPEFSGAATHLQPENRGGVVNAC